MVLSTERLNEQIDVLKRGEVISEKHKKFLLRKLDKTPGITAFDKALEAVFVNEKEIREGPSVFA